jgi:hypothetical protein
MTCPSLSNISSSPTIGLPADFDGKRSESDDVGSIIEYRTPRSRGRQNKKSAANSNYAPSLIGRWVGLACQEIEKLFGLFRCFHATIDRRAR